MSWKQRARRALKSEGERLRGDTVKEIAREGETAAQDLKFLLESSGAKVPEEISYSREGLLTAERAYRSIAGSLESEEREQLERLVGIFLGQVVIEQEGGTWAFYEGSYSPISPVVVRVDNGKHVDLLNFADGLADDRRVAGAKSGEALATFFDSTREDAFR